MHWRLHYDEIIVMALVIAAPHSKLLTRLPVWLIDCSHCARPSVRDQIVCRYTRAMDARKLSAGHTVVAANCAEPAQFQRWSSTNSNTCGYTGAHPRAPEEAAQSALVAPSEIGITARATLQKRTASRAVGNHGTLSASAANQLQAQNSLALEHCFAAHAYGRNSSNHTSTKPVTGISPGPPATRKK